MGHHRELLSTLLYNCKLLTQDHTDLLTMMMTMMMTMILLWSQRGYLVFDVGIEMLPLQTHCEVMGVTTCIATISTLPQLY